MKAYAQTEKNLKEALNYQFWLPKSVGYSDWPIQIYFLNLGIIFEYLEHYNQAVRSDFETAHKIDPNLGADKKCEGIIAFVATILRCYNSINQNPKGQVEDK